MNRVAAAPTAGLATGGGDAFRPLAIPAARETPSVGGNIPGTACSPPSRNSRSVVSNDGRPSLSKREFAAIAGPIIARGGTWQDVGDAIGISRGAARMRGRRAGVAGKGVPGPKIKWTPELCEKIRELAGRRGGLKVVAAQFGINHSALRMALSRNDRKLDAQAEAGE